VRPKNPVGERANFALVMAFSLLYLSPVLHFWGAAFGFVRPAGTPPPAMMPTWSWFLAGLAACFLPCLLPAAYFRSWEGEGGIRVWEALGVRRFKRFVTIGDLVNRLARRSDPRYRIVRDAVSARAWGEEAASAELHHLVFLLMSLLTITHAVRLGWFGWAMYLAVSNLIFNVYPILLQRYTRGRIARVCGPSKMRKENP